jgi:HK97 family phage portal protein
MLFWQQTTSGGRYPKEQTYWNAEDFLYFREFNPIDDLGQGVSATHVVLNDAQINASVTRFLGNFFTADALPLTLVMLNKNTKSDERDRVQGWFSDRLRRLKNAVARVLAVTDDVKVEKLTSELKSFEFEKIDEHVLNAVSNAYQIPKSVLDSRADSYATAQVGMASFINNTVVPRAMYFQEGINKLLKDFGQRIKFRPEEMSENQVDETERASSMAQMVTAGMPLLAALDILGYDLSPEAERIIKQGIEKKVKPTNGAAAPPYVDTGNNVLF